MTDKTLGAYERHESPDYADGGVAAALIEKEAENADTAVDYHAMWRKAEREREKAERERDSWESIAQQTARSVEALRAEQPRPLAPDAITDEMIERARQRGSEIVGALWDASVVEAMLTAALTEPPARPEGAEEIEFLIADRLGGDVPGDVIRALADEIAERAGATRLYPEGGAA